ncbi:CD226 antigen isoform X1 [Salvelinus sp. IW2-2015]|uniref:CD226 antigen isoform X1 n=1 Tax=Salvelinus sp. IW2-2015 TaxID=2691554 RepID=UPI000CDF9D0E|nr:CD226 antigen isoform X1 [Salvelinus alpinus]
MEAVQKDHWYFMVLLIFLSSLKVSVQQRDGVTTVKLKEGMVLECVCPWEGNLSMVSWTKLIRFEKAPVAVYHPEYGVSISQYYQTRIQFRKTIPMDGSITISKVTQEDAGLYHCSVQTFPKGSWARDIRVEVEDTGTVEEDDAGSEADGDTNIHTREPEPEVIQADTELIAERSDNLTISCNHEHNGTVYDVTVEKLDHGSASGVGIMAKCRLENGGLFGVDYTHRGIVNCSDRLDTRLQLNDVGEEDGGLYRCLFNTDAGVQTTTVLLTVLSPVEFSLSEYLIYIGGGVSGLLLLLSVIVILVVWQRKKKMRAKYITKMHPAQRQFCNDYENVPVYDRMRKGTNQRGDSPVYGNIRSHTKRKR